MFNIEYASLSINEKQKVKPFLLKIPVDPKSFSSVSSFRASHNALRNVRTNMGKVISHHPSTYAVTSEYNTVISPQQGEDSSPSMQKNNTVVKKIILMD